MADVNLQLEASFAGDANFPSIQADFHLDWAWSSADTSADETSSGGTPEISFTNVRLSLGEFFSEFVGPILGTVQDILEPFQPIVEILTAPIPVISQLMGSEVTFVDIAVLLNPDNQQLEMLRTILDVIEIINQVPVVDGNVFLELGDFDLGSFDPRGQLDLGFATPNVTRLLDTAQRFLRRRHGEPRRHRRGHPGDSAQGRHFRGRGGERRRRRGGRRRRHRRHDRDQPARHRRRRKIPRR